jgi:hypothetical protein
MLIKLAYFVTWQNLKQAEWTYYSATTTITKLTRHLSHPQMLALAVLYELKEDSIIWYNKQVSLLQKTKLDVLVT